MKPLNEYIEQRMAKVFPLIAHHSFAEYSAELPYIAWMIARSGADEHSALSCSTGEHLIIEIHARTWTEAADMLALAKTLVVAPITLSGGNTIVRCDTMTESIEEQPEREDDASRDFAAELEQTILYERS